LPWLKNQISFSDEIHQFGLEEVTELRHQAEDVVEKLGYNSSDLRQAFEKIRNEKSQQFTSKQEILDHLEGLVAKINPKLSDIFGPEIARPEILQVDVKASPSSGGTIAYYQEPSLDGRRKGAFYISLASVASW
jgi:uncharacterized protein (DUF885 family)